MKVIRLDRGWQAISQIYFFPALNAINYSDISRMVYWVKSLNQSNAISTDPRLASILPLTAERINKSNTTRVPTWLTEWSSLRHTRHQNNKAFYRDWVIHLCFPEISLITCFSHLSDHVASHRCVTASFWNVTLQFSEVDRADLRDIWEKSVECWK